MTGAGLWRAAIGCVAGFAALAGCSAPPVAAPPHRAKPMRVMSMNQCADQLVLALLPPERITSVSWLSRNPEGSLMAQEAMQVGVNHGLAEEVVRQRPDLVVAGKYTTTATRAMLRRLGYPMVEVDDAQSYDDIRRITRDLARALGEEARGEVLIARMDRQLADLARSPGPALRVAAWDGAGFNAHKGSLYDTILSTVGAHNVANEIMSGGYGRPNIEVLLQSAPTLLVKGSGVGRHPGISRNAERHPLVRRFWDGDRTLTIPQAYYICGTPMVADAAVRLRDDLAHAAGAVKAPLPFAQDHRL